MSDEKPLTEEELNWLDSYNFWEDEQPREHEDVVHRASKEIRSLRARVKALEEALNGHHNEEQFPELGEVCTICKTALSGRDGEK